MRHRYVSHATLYIRVHAKHQHIFRQQEDRLFRQFCVSQKLWVDIPFYPFPLPLFTGTTTLL